MSDPAPDGPETSEVPTSAAATSPVEPPSPGVAPPGDAGPDAALDLGSLSGEGLLDDVERLTGERDEYLGRLQRAQADFENAKKRLQREGDERAEALAGRLVDDLLPVLDACDAAIAHEEEAVKPVFAALLQALEKNGLQRIDPGGDVFDPNHHEAVLHEPAGPDDDPALTVVVEVLRIGYGWKGRVVRPAMVKVRG